jgi:hydroxymethylbilane synthase
MRPDLRVDSIRGNVQTRLSKLDGGEFDAIVLAQAGLSRLGLARSDAYPFSVAQCLPAPGQGALGIEIVTDSPVQALLETLIDKDVARCVEAERGISAGLGADCALPVAAHAELTTNGEIHLRALVAQADGSRVLRAEGHGAEPGPLAQRLVEQLLSQGADSILANARHV